MNRVLVYLFVFSALDLTVFARAQEAPAALRQIDFSAFGAFTSASTGLSGGHNTDVTAGFDLNLPSLSLFRPGLEARATYPFEHDGIDRQHDIVAGPRLELNFTRLHPYADFLVGSGRINYGDSRQGYVTYGGVEITGYSNSTIYSPGIGASFDFSPHIAAFADLQMQHWDTPVSLSGHLLAKPFSIGLKYRFGVPGHAHNTNF